MTTETDGLPSVENQQTLRASAFAFAKGQHVPVLLGPVLEGLNVQPGKLYVDATLGGGGHAKAILERILPTGKLIGLDQDALVLAETTQAMAQWLEQNEPHAPSNAFLACHSNFKHLPQQLQALGISQITGGLLLDLGVSSFQLDRAERGFSFSKPAPLDMRMDRSQPLTAADVVNTYSEQALIQVFSQYGEARFSKTIARRVVAYRQTQGAFSTTTQLADLVQAVYAQHGLTDRQRGGGRSKSKKPGVSAVPKHPATQIFQAIRMVVNQELDVLEALLQTLPALLAPGARLAVISFHSLEDRLVKRFLRDESRAYEAGCKNALFGDPVGQAHFRCLTAKPIVASEDEQRQNPRSRSAKLRIAERTNRA
ncbi:MAG: 16S rRNA (cytosine(1402)-N(4))-methyltransferase RsmH [Candidatus Melainabacteria bacterium]|nr:16S rRNA (cytosine(1402)-N(4))-methyltransferase RsmH [Candidatus Melainabacteria bacterium]